MQKGEILENSEGMIFGIPYFAIVVLTVLLGAGIIFVFMPNLTNSVFPFGLRGRGRRIFSWTFLLFACAIVAAVVVDHLSRIE